MKNYYRLATEVDAVCRKLVAELKAQGQLDNTLVIFTTDNGYFHAEHGLLTNGIRIRKASASRSSSAIPAWLPHATAPPMTASP